MALQWHELGQNLDPLTERTFTTFVVQPGFELSRRRRDER